ncbi:hypothetical protein FGG08_005104 [Glutinoglossum americanum]|uniref:L-type lectin-like domain-containing protein n=1 Tax=Glutinoglossum americanum TaxID=1670608 RepID=A0A9P8I7V3_9PEZI|nr:hypothetical protein FGG08_005104 [Glutinoglossum americanum]
MLMVSKAYQLSTSILGVFVCEVLLTSWKYIQLRTHTLTTPYLTGDLQSRWFDFGGDTIIRADKYVRLTSDRPSQQGWLFSRVPLTATNWEIEVEFKIDGNGNLHGDGMALWVTKQRATQGPVFGSTDQFEGLGIFFDTYKNNRPGVTFPYVMAMLGDGKTKYDHGNDGKANELAGCSARIRKADVPTKARLTYFQDSYLKLDLQYRREDEWTECFTASDVRLPSVAYLGFSAETGELSDEHDIISVSTKSLYEHNTASGSGGRPGHASDSTSWGGKKGKGYDPNRGKSRGWGWVFIKLVLVVVGCIGAYVGYTAWRTQQRRSRF